jgi:hypothetical protein
VFEDPVGSNWGGCGGGGGTLWDFDGGWDVVSWWGGCREDLVGGDGRCGWIGWESCCRGERLQARQMPFRELCERTLRSHREEPSRM